MLGVWVRRDVNTHQCRQWTSYGSYAIQCCFTSAETIRLNRDGEKVAGGGGGGGGVWRWGKRESIYLSLHCHHQNNSCVKFS